MRLPHIRATGLGLVLLAVLCLWSHASAAEYTLQDWRGKTSIAHPLYDAFWGDVILRQSEEVVNDPEALLNVVKRSRNYRNLCRQLEVEDLDVTYVNRDLIQFYINLTQALRAGRSAALAELPALANDTSHVERSRIRNEATQPFTEAMTKVDLLRQASIRVMLTGGDILEADVNEEVARIVRGLNPALSAEASTWVDTLGRERREQEQQQEAEEQDAQAKIPTQAQLARLRAKILQTRAHKLELQEQLDNTTNDITRLRLEAERIKVDAELDRLRGIWETNQEHDQSGAADPFAGFTTDTPESDADADLPFKPIDNPTPDQIRRLRTRYVNQRTAITRLDEAIQNAPSDIVRSMLQTQRDAAQEQLDDLQVRWNHYKQYDPSWTE